MAKQDHLTKERELELGVIIQKRYKAEKRLESTRIGEATRNKLEAEVVAGDQAIAELVAANMGLVYHRARVFKSKFPGAPDIEDLASMGFMGLMVAVEKYDPTRGNKFSTVAHYWISQAIGREVNKTSRLVRLPENRIADYSKMNGVASKYEESGIHGSELDDKIMDELKLTKVEIMNIRNAAAAHSSLNRKIGGGSDESAKELMDIVGEEKATLGTEVSVTNNECFTILKGELSRLPELKRIIIAAQFGLPIEGADYSTPKEVREHFSLSSSKYRRLLGEGLEQVRTSLASKDLMLTDFLEA